MPTCRLGDHVGHVALEWPARGVGRQGCSRITAGSEHDQTLPASSRSRPGTRRSNSEPMHDERLATTPAALRSKSLIVANGRLDQDRRPSRRRARSGNIVVPTSGPGCRRMWLESSSRLVLNWPIGRVDRGQAPASRPRSGAGARSAAAPWDAGRSQARRGRVVDRFARRRCAGHPARASGPSRVPPGPRVGKCPPLAGSRRGRNRPWLRAVATTVRSATLIRTIRAPHSSGRAKGVRDRAGECRGGTHRPWGRETGAARHRRACRRLPQADRSRARRVISAGGRDPQRPRRGRGRRT